MPGTHCRAYTIRRLQEGLLAVTVSKPEAQNMAT